MWQERGGSGVSVRLVAGAGGSQLSPWRTPTPYVFLGLAFMMGVIAVSLLLLICMRSSNASSSLSSSRQEADDEEKAAAAARALEPLDREPKVVVFMPGDHAPSFLASAKPLSDGAAAV